MRSAALALVVLPVLLVGALVALALVLSRRPAPAPSLAAEQARRHGLVVTVAAWVLPLTVGTMVIGPLAVVAFRVMEPMTWNAILAGLYPAVLGLEYLGVHAVGERTWPRPAGPVRRAALVHRRVADVAPTWLRRLTLGWALTAALALLVFGLTAAADDRSVRHGSGAASPYPGWDFGVPLLVAVVAVTLAAEAVLRLVARRPAIVDADPVYDAGSRRLSAHRALRGAQLVLGGTLAGILVVGGNALQSVGLRGVGAPVTVAGFVVALTALVLSVVPAAGPAIGTATGPAMGPATDLGQPSRAPLLPEGTA